MRKQWQAFLELIWSSRYDPIASRERRIALLQAVLAVAIALAAGPEDLRGYGDDSVHGIARGCAVPGRNVGWRTARGVEHLELHSQHRVPNTTAGCCTRRHFATQQGTGLDIRCWTCNLVRGHGSQLPLRGCIGPFSRTNEWVAA